MKSGLWRAIDRLGSRLAARLDWETASGLLWEDLSPFLAPARGKFAQEVDDPDEPGRRLVVWQRDTASMLLESVEFPAHRQPLSCPPESCLLHGLNLKALASELGRTMDFIPIPPTGTDDIQQVGFVQSPGQGKIDVFLLVPRTPGSARQAAQRLIVTNGKRRTILLLPSARWHGILPQFPSEFEVRVLAEFLDREEGDSLLAVASTKGDALRTVSTAKPEVLQVRQGDRWGNLMARFDPSNGLLELRIEKRSLRVRVWDTRTEPSKAAVILGKLLQKSPPCWTVSDLSGKEQGAMRQAFRRFQDQLMEWAPIPDGRPFDYDRTTKRHYPRFTLKRE